jgi:2,3-bisphosphoglycerate-independent phosphoglycerate mutase
MQITNGSQMLFKQHPVNLKREKEGKLPANSIWLWGQGKRPQMPTLQEKFNLNGAVISAVDLIKGIGIYAGLEVINVPGATGYIDTNYKGKAEAAIDALKRLDYVYVHVEAPDEAAHGGNLKDKIKAIEDFDRDVVGTVMQHAGSLGDYRLMVLPDHPTPVEKMTHTKDPVPFIIYGSQGEYSGSAEDCVYSEKSAMASGVTVAPGHLLMQSMIDGCLP